MSGSAFKVTVNFETREDGGVRAYSDDVPGLILSSRDLRGLVDDVLTALQVCLSKQLEAEVRVEPLADIRLRLHDRLAVPTVTASPGLKEFVAHVH